MSGADDSAGYELDPEPVALAPEPVEIQGASCKQCSYDLSGLVETGVCPECGLAIERSLTEDFLEFSAPAYLKSLHTGVVLILTAIIMKTAIVLSILGLGFLSSSNTTGIEWVFTGLRFFEFGVSLLLAGGWWMFSALDPAFVGRLDGSTYRKAVRITTLLGAGVSVVLFPLQVLSNYAMSLGLMSTVAILGLLSFVFWVVGFFAAMYYLRWLSPRFPNRWVYKRAKLLMWLGPILFTVGWLCVGLGPLVAVILYWNMLNWVRLDLKSIREGHSIMLRDRYFAR